MHDRTGHCNQAWPKRHTLHLSMLLVDSERWHQVSQRTLAPAPNWVQGRQAHRPVHEQLTTLMVLYRATAEPMPSSCRGGSRAGVGAAVGEVNAAATPQAASNTTQPRAQAGW